jgi:hypothetical protein
VSLPFVAVSAQPSVDVEGGPSIYVLTGQAMAPDVTMADNTSLSVNMHQFLTPWLMEPALKLDLYPTASLIGFMMGACKDEGHEPEAVTSAARPAPVWGRD